MNKFTEIEKGVYQTNSVKTLKPIVVPENYVIDCAQFSYDMTFGKKGEHKNGMDGSTYVRSDSEIFAHAFQGKMAEFAIYDYVKKHGVDISKPNIEVFKKGKWDNCDLESGNDTISVKSTPGYMKFLKLNYADYELDGAYKYGYGKYKYDDYIAYARVLPNINSMMRNSLGTIDALIKTDSLTASDLERLITNETWKADLTGYITREQFREEVIGNDQVVEKDDMVDGFKMFSKIYYAQSGDLSDIDMLCEALSDGYLDDNLDEVEKYIDSFIIEEEEIIL